MNHLLNVLVLITILLSGISARAGFDKGNGGDVLVCSAFSGGMAPATVHLVDELEGSVEWQLGGYRFAATLEDRIQVLAQHLPKLAERMLIEWHWVTQHLQFVSGVQLVDLDDDQLYWQPAHCSRQQVAIQNTSTVLIDTALWQQMTREGQAMLISHEILYRILDRDRTLGPLANSKPVRFLNALLWSTDLEQKDLSGLSKTFANWHTYVWAFSEPKGPR